MGAYTVSAVTSDGCFSNISNSIGVSALGLEPSTGKNVIVMPNPVEDRISLKIPEGEGFKALKVFDNSGKAVFESNISNPSLRHLTAGQYLLKVETDVETYAVKLIKK